MPNITRIVGMHNLTPEANRDAVWAGLILRHDNGQYQFVALNGRRLGMLRETAQPPTSSYTARQKFDQMYREKLAHGYEVIEWLNLRYGLLNPVRRLGDFSAAENILPAEAVVPPARQVPPVSLREIAPERPTATADPEAERSVATLADYIARNTGAPEAPKPNEQPPIRKARRLDF